MEIGSLEGRLADWAQTGRQKASKFRRRGADVVGKPDTSPAAPTSTSAGDISREARLLVRVARALGLDPEGGPDGPVLPDGPALMDAATSAASSASLVRYLSCGLNYDEAFVASVRDIMRAGEWHRARALSDALGRSGQKDLSNLCLGLTAHRREWHELAVQQWAEVSDDLLMRTVPLEAVESHLAESRPDSESRVPLLVAALPDDGDLGTRVEVAGRLLAYNMVDLAAEVAGSIPADAELSAGHRTTLALLGEAQQSADEDAVYDATIGVIDYRQPDSRRSSSNIGDYIQTLAVLGNLARRRDLRFFGDPDLADFVTELQQVVPSHLQVSGDERRVKLLPIHRDFSSVQALPRPTWFIAFGWHMHSLFGLRYDFPYHHNIRPLFLSWHLNRPEVLTPPVVEYLKRYGPIGCRDWTTVFVLLSAGIDAFFTGCVTSTVDGAVPDTGTVDESAKVVGAVDLTPARMKKIKAPYEEFRHASDDVVGLGLADGLGLAQDTLVHYKRHYRRVVTSRLHSYLPATSLGIPAKFVPRKPGDPRFAGLRDMTPDSPSFVAMRDGLRDLLQQALSLVTGDLDEDQVYEQWRAITQPMVDDAKRRYSGPAMARPLHADLDAMVATIRSEAVSFNSNGDETSASIDVALSCDENLADVLPVTVESIVSNASRPLHLWIMTRGLDQAYWGWLAAAFPTTEFTFLPCDHVNYGDVLRMIKHITLSTMDRLLLPDLLPDVDRITYIDVDALVLGDVVDLAGTDLQGHPLAARASWYPGHLWWWKAAMDLDPERADDLRRTIAAKQGLGHQAFNAGILVLDLAAMRRDHFTQTYLPYVEHYGLNDQDVLMAYTGAGRLDLDPTWNFWPVMELGAEPNIVHYVGASKPWGELVTPYDELWKTRFAAVKSRASWPPPQCHSKTHD